MAVRTESEPRSGGYFELSTDAIAAHQRREFWRDTMLNRSDADFRADAAERGFSASVRGFISDNAELREGSLEAGILRRGAARCRHDGGDEILMTVVMSPQHQIAYRDDEGSFLIPAGRFLVTDMSVPFAVEMGRFRTINFRLPRASVARAIGVSPVRRNGRLLPATPLASLLFEQMVRFANALPTMDDDEREVALDATANFALATLRLDARAAPQGAPWEDGRHWSGLWTAAERFIERHLDRADLSPDMLARGLKCSRTQLYRLFARHDVSVMDHVRDMRLSRCRDMLADRDCQMPIAEIALLCGMDDPSAFSRRFRRRFGCAPGELRRMSRERQRSG